MKLDVLHIDQGRARVIRKRVPVAGAIPTVACDLVGFPDSASREHDSFRAENFEAASLTIVAERADNTLAILD